MTRLYAVKLSRRIMSYFAALCFTALGSFYALSPDWWPLPGSPAGWQFDRAPGANVPSWTIWDSVADWVLILLGLACMGLAVVGVLFLLRWIVFRVIPRRE